jgi:hypothetical protein
MHSHRAELMRALLAVLILVACCTACSLVTAWLLNPMQSLNETQSVVMQEYLAAFCSKDERHDKQFVIGTAAALSRIVVKANLGNLALAEFAKCQVRVGG